MKQKIKYLLLLLTFLFVTNSKAQSLNALDAKLGQYNFKLGDSYQKWSSHLQLFLSGNIQKSYFYNSDKTLSIYDYPVKKVLLTFVNQKLALITIELSIWDEPINGGYSDLDKSLEKFASLFEKYKSLYGKPTENKADEKTGNVAIYWEGKSKYLLSKLTNLGVKKGSKVVIDFGDKNQMSSSISNYLFQ